MITILLIVLGVFLSLVAYLYLAAKRKQRRSNVCNLGASTANDYHKVWKK